MYHQTLCYLNKAIKVFVVWSRHLHWTGELSYGSSERFLFKPGFEKLFIHTVAVIVAL